MVFYAPGEIPEPIRALIETRNPGMDPADLIPSTMDAIVKRIEEYVNVGFSKLVLVPMHEPADWLAELEPIAERMLAPPNVREDYGIAGVMGGWAPSPVTSGDRARLMVPAIITAIAASVSEISAAPVAPSTSPNNVSPMIDDSTGFVTASAGSDAARWPAWNALWLRISPATETRPSM